MFEKEERELKNLKEKYENVDIPFDEIDEAIQIGFQNAKEVKMITEPKQKFRIWSIVAAAIFLFGILASIRVSPTFADYLTKVPGMEKIVEMVRVRQDKGLISAVENKYIQKIGTSQEKNGIKVTIDSVIADEQDIVLFYTIDSKSKQKNFVINAAYLKPSNGEKLPEHSLSFGGTVDKVRGQYTSTVEYDFNKPYEQQDFNLVLNIKNEKQSAQFSIPLSIKKHEKTNQIYELNKTVMIENQRIKIKKVTIYPLRVAVQVEMDPSNSKKILDFTDIKLVDQNGEVWSKITNGTTAKIISDNERIVFLQSNYFKDPKELYFVINKLQAIDKEDEYLIVDTEKQKILKQPKGNYLSDLKKEGDTIFFTLNTKKEFNYDMIGSIFDANGKEIEINESYMEGNVSNKQRIGFKISSRQKYMNPIKINLVSFPSYIEGDAKIKVK
ncbi:DUF4179 domain-containing protein [Gottfriedia acidiceleris]|uniref:DUF4179 domain-containing protein n=1 Tax=Gottfriedia acidiceleris TaxID=371036 RepID=UPI0013EB0831|nr:DUF4179 domain-containing protein [Gottfriedia acidiceleris]